MPTFLHTGKTSRKLEWKAYKAYTKKFYGNGFRPGDSVPEKPSIEKRKTFWLLVLHPTSKDKAFSFHSSKLHLFRSSPPLDPSIRDMPSLTLILVVAVATSPLLFRGTGNARGRPLNSVLSVYLFTS